MREDLRSEDGIVCCDMDYLVHRYKTAADGRDVQCIMFVEVKTRGAGLTDSQRDTLVLLDQYLNNRRETPTKKNSKRVLNEARTKAFSVVSRKYVMVRAFGGYLLQFQHTGPDDGWIKWGPKRIEITPDQLAAIIRFDLDPDTLAPMDLRRHHKPPDLPLFPDGIN